jgi:hypothetical protein
MKVKEENDVTVRDKITSVVLAGIQSLEQLQQSGRGSGRLVEVYRQCKKTGKLTPTHLLLSMKESLAADEMDLSFDNIGFFDTCLNMFGDILTQCEPHIPARTASHEGIERLYASAYDCVYAILWDVADRSTSNSSLQQSLFFRA